MEKTKEYITILSGAINLLTDCANKKEYGVSFFNVLKAVNMLDVYDVIIEQEEKTRDHALIRWLESESIVPETLMKRWSSQKSVLDEYMKLSHERTQKFIEHYGKTPQPKYIVELVEAIDKKLEALIKAWNPQKRFHVDLSKKKMTRIFDELKAGDFISPSTYLNDFLSAMGYDDKPFHRIEWTKKASRNKKVSKSSLINFLSVIGIEGEDIKNTVNSVFFPELSSKDKSHNYVIVVKSEYHEEFIKMING